MASSVTSSTARTYRDAAREHLARADALWAGEQYFLAHYMAGLAVECYLRACLRRRTDDFDARHDLNHLARQAGFYDLLPQNRVEDFSFKFSRLNLRWQSNHRYFSERQFLDFMKEPQAGAMQDLRARGDKLKNLSRTALNIAYEIISMGETKWKKEFEKS